MKKIFGTDGVRGLANVYPVTPEMAMSLGQAVAKLFRHKKSTRRVVIGKDTRRSSYMIEQAIAAGVCSMGSEAVFLGPIPTPGVAFLTKAMRADCGVMISASHNAYSDNGIKFFDANGFKLTDDNELEIETFIENELKNTQRPTGRNVGKAYRVEGAQGRYVEFLKRAFPKDYTLEGLKVVVDCANGAAYHIAPQVLWELGAEVISLGVDPNGLNINTNCGALHPENLSHAVRECKADMGLALDGDADRVVLCDENGNIIHGDCLIAMCALELLNQGLLKNKKIVGTILTNMGVENYLKQHGIDMIRTQVGDRYIIEVMREQGLLLGGEPSGHVIFSRHTTTGDGMVAGLQILATMVQSQKKLSELVAEIPLYPQIQHNIKIQNKKVLAEVQPIQQALKDIDQRLAGKLRVILRYSGTEPLLRLMIEGQDPQIMQQEKEYLSGLIATHLGVSGA